MLDLGPDFFVSRGPPQTFEQILPTAGFTQAKNRIEQDLASGRGNIRLIIGHRGCGKSTCLDYLKTTISKQGAAKRTVYFDAGLRIPRYLTLSPAEAVNEFMGDLTYEISGGKTREFLDLVKRLASAKTNFFLFVDNLDRLHQTKADLDFVNHFFRVADPAFKELEKRLVIVITAAPEWDPIVAQQDLSYLNYKNCIDLRPVTYDELKQLLTRRLGGKALSTYFSDEFLHALHTACRSNPRTAIQYLELFKVSPHEFLLPLVLADFNKVLPIELAEGAIEHLKEIAAGDAQVSWGANQLFRFFDDLEKAGVESAQGSKFILKAMNRNEFDYSLVPTQRAAARISHIDEDSGRRALNQQIRDLTTKWGKKTGISKETLLTIFAERPFAATTTDVQEYAEEYFDGYERHQTASDLFQAGLHSYTNLRTKELKDWDRKALILNAWYPSQYLILSCLASLGRGKKDLKKRLASQSDFATASEELLVETGEIFRHLQMHNPHRTELIQLKEMMNELYTNPTVISHWEDYQIAMAHKSGLKTYESLLRLLTPKRLREAYSTDDELVLKYLKESETGRLEFKSSLSYDMATGRHKQELEVDAMKAVAGYANHKGGTVVIGISPHHEILGLQNDYSLLRDGNRDTFERKLMDVFERLIGRANVMLIDIHIRLADAQEVCEIVVRPSDVPVFMKDGAKNRLWVRMGNSTREEREMQGDELTAYLKLRFPAWQSPRPEQPLSG